MSLFLSKIFCAKFQIKRLYKLTCKQTTLNKEFKIVVDVYLESSMAALAARKLNCTFFLKSNKQTLYFMDVESFSSAA